MFWAETVGKIAQWLTLYLQLQMIYRRIKRDPQRMAYMDLAVAPVTDDEVDTREPFQSEAAHKFVIKIEKREKIRRGETV